MRAALSAAALGLALAACSVNVEGAQCNVPGSADQCPSGQACGTDGTCTVGAVACTSVCAREKTRCVGETGKELVETCTGADPVCGAWVTTSCTASGLVCDAANGTAACRPVPCTTPGSADGCPAEQACGNDGVCSALALSCLASRCTPGDTRCGGAGGTERVDVCTGADAVCGTWEASTSCAAGGLVCAASGAAACACPAPAPHQLYVDAGAGGTDRALVPTGAGSPPACRLGTITDALGRATAGTTVSVVGAPATYSGPQLRVPKGVSLVGGDAPLDPAKRILEDLVLDGPGVVLEEGARLAGFTVRAAAGDPRPLAIRVSCAAADKVTLEKVVVDAAADATLSTGVELGGAAACDVDLLDVRISGDRVGEVATTTGLEVAMAPASPSAVIQMTGGRVELCQTGIQLRSGDLRLDGTAIAGNSGTGVVAGDGGRDTQFTAIDAVFSSNGDTALELFGNDRIDLQRNRLCQNQSLTTKGTTSRKVGGMWARGAPPLSGLVFKGNEIHDNEADQVLVSGTPLTWNLDGGIGPSACDADRNRFFGYSGDGRGLVATIGASANARWNMWAGITPTPRQDYEEIGTGSTIDAGLPNSFCETVSPPRPCP